jgi:hypothetical protein
MNLDSTKSLNYLKKIPEFYREVVKCWNLSGGGQTKSPECMSVSYCMLTVVI